MSNIEAAPLAEAQPQGIDEAQLYLEGRGLAYLASRPFEGHGESYSLVQAIAKCPGIKDAIDGLFETVEGLPDAAERIERGIVKMGKSSAEINIDDPNGKKKETKTLI